MMRYVLYVDDDGVTVFEVPTNLPSGEWEWLRAKRRECGEKEWLSIALTGYDYCGREHEEGEWRATDAHCGAGEWVVVYGG